MEGSSAAGLGSDLVEVGAELLVLLLQEHVLLHSEAIRVGCRVHLCVVAVRR